MTTPATSRDFMMQLSLRTSAEKLFDALTTQAGCASWWTTFCEGDWQVDGISSYHFPAAGFHAVMRTIELERPTKLVWECIESSHSPSMPYEDLHDWIGTTIRFEIEPISDQECTFNFTHVRLMELECYESCKSGWQFFLGESLRGYVELGQGKPWTQG